MGDFQSHTEAQLTVREATVSTCFTCTRLNDTTFLIVEDDKWREVPFIYAKIYESSLVLMDTGCGGASRDKTVELTSLKDFIETFPVADNGGEPLNRGGQKKYIVLCTHCHFDHIGGIEQFDKTPGSAIWASSYDKDFIQGEGRLPTTSLCRFFDMETPEYKITNWADDGQHVTDNGQDLNLIIHHTPGHTRDQIAIWDPQERVIFVGDTVYEWEAIIFPLEGCLKLFSDTMVKLQTLIQGWNSETADGDPQTPKPRVKIACGHVTSNADAATLLIEVDEFLYRVAENQIEVKEGEEFRGEVINSYSREDGRLKLRAPKKVFDKFRNDEKAMESIRKRYA